MKKKLLVLILLITLLSSFVGFNLSVEGSLEVEVLQKDLADFQVPQFDNTVIITMDGASSKYMDKYLDDGSLVNTLRLLETGYRQKVRITSHRTSTDPGLATIESGFGPGIHSITYNMFGEGTIKLSIPDNLTISERLKEAFGDTVKTGFVFAWGLDDFDFTYMSQPPSRDSTFDYMKNELDFRFASENISWVPGDPEALAATYHGFDENLGLYGSPVIQDSYLGQIAADWIPTVKNDRFYLRIHLTEPDQDGHGYGADSAEYKESMIGCDAVVGQILDELEDANILDKTLVMVGTDHGMYGTSHGAGPWPDIADDLNELVFVVSHTSVRHEESIAAGQQDIAPTVLATMGVDLSSLTPEYINDDDTGIPFWEKTEDRAPNIKNVYFKTKDMDNYGLITQGGEIKGTFDLKLDIIEWSPLRTATVQIGDTIINADFNSSRGVQWFDLNSKDIGKGVQTLSFTLIDPFGNEATDDISLTLTAPSAFWASILPILAISTILVLRRKKK
ncbi:MAG: alkaline phosphatase family protein [Candidatus Heimdallarchaeaceae archaeon]|jgi:predicted AlkP superfamily pyrophosphatase or phosphodiesterase